MTSSPSKCFSAFEQVSHPQLISRKTIVGPLSSHPLVSSQCGNFHFHLCYDQNWRRCWERNKQRPDRLNDATASKFTGCPLRPRPADRACRCSRNDLAEIKSLMNDGKSTADRRSSGFQPKTHQQHICEEHFKRVKGHALPGDQPPREPNPGVRVLPAAPRWPGAACWGSVWTPV